MIDSVKEQIQSCFSIKFSLIQLQKYLHVFYNFKISASVELYFPGIIFHKLKQDPVPDDVKMDDAENIPVTQKEEAMTDLGQLCMKCEVSDRVMCLSE